MAAVEIKRYYFVMGTNLALPKATGYVNEDYDGVFVGSIPAMGSMLSDPTMYGSELVGCWANSFSSTLTVAVSAPYDLGFNLKWLTNLKIYRTADDVLLYETAMSDTGFTPQGTYSLSAGNGTVPAFTDGQEVYADITYTIPSWIEIGDTNQDVWLAEAKYGITQFKYSAAVPTDTTNSFVYNKGLYDNGEIVAGRIGMKLWGLKSSLYDNSVVFPHFS